MKFREEDDVEVPSASAYHGQFLAALQNWEEVVSKFPEDAQEQLDTLVLRLEGTSEVDTGMVRQIAAVFKANSIDENGTQLAYWLDVIADFADFFAKATNAIVDASLGSEDDEEPSAADSDDAPDEEPAEEPVTEPAEEPKA